MKILKSFFLWTILAAVSAVHAYHDGDLIYGIIGNQIQIVEPTDALTNPPRKVMNFVPPDQGLPAFYATDQGFDYWDIPGYGITTVKEARIICIYIDPRLRVLSGGRTYFSIGADFSSFLFRGSQRHKHFAVETPVLKRGMRYVFQFQLIDAIDVNGNPVANSPVYTVYYETPPLLKLGNAIRKDL